MKIHPLRRLLAHGVPLSVLGSSTCVVAILAWQYPPQLPLLTAPSFVFVLLLWLVPELLLFAGLALLFVSPVVGTICVKLNGAPFEVGDEVCILTGPHRGRVVRVYDVWSSRGQVRVDLGEPAKREAVDVFSGLHVWRPLSRAGQSVPADAPASQERR